jgi:hypothetical protein
VGLKVIEELKMLAEFLGLEIFDEKDISPPSDTLWVYIDKKKKSFIWFEPFKEEQVHWQKKILRKFDGKQYGRYYNKMKAEHYNKPLMTLAKWVCTAPAEVSYKCICEVLKEGKE